VQTGFNVIVQDKTPPTITLLGSTTVSQEIGNAYVDAGATASDIVDGSLTSSIVTVSTVNTGAVGTYSVTYNVTDAHGNVATQVTRTVNITKKTTTTTLVSSLNPSQFTDSVKFTVTVTGYSPTGTVDITDGALTLATVTLSHGSGSFTTSTLSVRTHSLTATYNGDASNLTSNGSLSQVVNKANSTITLTSDLNPSSFGDSVKLTAIVSPAAATGSISFLSGSGILITLVPDVTGKATFNTQMLLIGTHALSAVYNGNGNYLTSTSTTLTQTVNPPAGNSNGSTSRAGGGGGSGRRGGGLGIAPGAFGGPTLATGTLSETKKAAICQIASRLKAHPSETIINNLSARISRTLHADISIVKKFLQDPSSCK
jgi:hypothetical protein